MTVTPSAHAIQQYATTTTNLTARIALHAYSTNPQDWVSWLDERLPLAGAVLEVGAGTGKLWTRVDQQQATAEVRRPRSFEHRRSGHGCLVAVIADSRLRPHCSLLRPWWCSFCLIRWRP